MSSISCSVGQTLRPLDNSDGSTFERGTFDAIRIEQVAVSVKNSSSSLVDYSHLKRFERLVLAEGRGFGDSTFGLVLCATGTPFRRNFPFLCSNYRASRNSFLVDFLEQIKLTWSTVFFGVNESYEYL